VSRATTVRLFYGASVYQFLPLEYFGSRTLFTRTTCRLVPTRCPILFLTRTATVAGGLALRAHLEVLQVADHHAPGVLTVLTPFQRSLAEYVEVERLVMTPLPQPVLSKTSGGTS